MADEEFTLEDETLDDAELEGETGEEEEQEGSESEPEAQEPEEYEIVLEGDEQASQEQKQKSVTLPAKKLADLRASRRESRDEAARLKEEVELLRKQVMSGGKPQQPAAMPTLESVDYDEAKYQQALAAWHQEQTKAQLQTYNQQLAQEQARNAQKQAQEAEIEKHYERAASLKVHDYESAERTVRETLDQMSQDVSVTDLMIAHLGEGSEKVTYFLGRNPDKLSDLVATLQADPSGMRAMVKLGQLQAKLSHQPAKKKISQAPAADEALGGKNGASEGAILKRLEKLNSRTDRTEFRKLKSQLVAAGKLSLLQKHGFA